MRDGCEEHGKRFWVESYPPGHGQCRRCAELWCELTGSRFGKQYRDPVENHNGAGCYDSDTDFA